MIAMENVTYYNNVSYWEGFDLMGSDETITQRLVQGTFEKLDTIDCLNAYAQDFQNSWGDLLVVAEADIPAGDPNQTAVFAGIDNVGGVNFNGTTWHYAAPYPWICRQITPTSSVFCPSHLDSFRNNISSWQPFGYPVAYCLSEPQTEICRVQADLSLGLIAGILSLAKVIILCIVFFTMRQNPLLTTGDAVFSFITDPDVTTKDMCLLNRYEVTRFYPKKNTTVTPTRDPFPPSRLSAPRPFQAERRKWAVAVSRRRWLFFFILYSSLNYLNFRPSLLTVLATPAF
jgi:hypothetical protein